MRLIKPGARRRVVTDQEINEAVARKLGFDVLSGGTLMVKPQPDEDAEKAERLPDYCHSIETAWEIIDKGFVNGVHQDPLLKGWAAYVGNTPISKADTAPMAIALAFLKLDAR